MSKPTSKFEPVHILTPIKLSNQVQTNPKKWDPLTNKKESPVIPEAPTKVIPEKVIERSAAPPSLPQKTIVATQQAIKSSVLENNDPSSRFGFSNSFFNQTFETSTTITKNLVKSDNDKSNTTISSSSTTTTTTKITKSKLVSTNSTSTFSGKSNVAKDTNTLKIEEIFDDLNLKHPALSENKKQPVLNNFSTKATTLSQNTSVKVAPSVVVPPPPPPHKSSTSGMQPPKMNTTSASTANFLTGGKKALLIGINYTGQKNPLSGCQNDVKNLKTYLNLNEKDLMTLTDNHSTAHLKPTKKNILMGIDWLKKDAKIGDQLIFHFSGHGGQIKCTEDEYEEDGFDEVIFPLDYEAAGCIVDNDLYKVLVKDLPTGVHLTAIFDSCHSGSILDLPYEYNLEQKRFTAINSTKAKKFDSGWSMNKKDNIGSHQEKAPSSVNLGNVICLSGCKDSQTCSDVKYLGTAGKEATGAMSNALLTTLKANPNQSYSEMLNSLKVILEGKFNQLPQLSCSSPIDVNKKFSL
ncbi:Ca(2+)-dependent cysteine protease [Clydaea vesicula]|uniref:Ca(2+)-dependent cysteine protease n=1 Tax=Clydaea vesicula TaxID=447962 RepID=A0AAD5TYJ4_9FUNG|nr:Ca(2+)-dependent cysteine protease [Clydaea vesicula]